MSLPTKEGYWTPLEKQTRDLILFPITWPLTFIPYAANILTVSGFLILFYAIYDFYITRDYKHQIWLLAAAWLTDLFDGPTARNSKNITAFGTAADHIRDYFISFWMVVLAFHITAQAPELWIVYWILGFTIVGMLTIVIHNLLYQREKRKERKGSSYALFIKEFLLKDLTTSLTARIHTVVLAVAGVSYIAGVVLGNVYTEMGVVLLLLQLCILGFYIHEMYQTQYEDKVRKIVTAREVRISRLKKIIAKLKGRAVFGAE